MALSSSRSLRVAGMAAGSVRAWMASMSIAAVVAVLWGNDMVET